MQKLIYDENGKKMLLYISIYKNKIYTPSNTLLIYLPFSIISFINHYVEISRLSLFLFITLT